MKGLIISLEDIFSSSFLFEGDSIKHTISQNGNSLSFSVCGDQSYTAKFMSQVPDGMAVTMRYPAFFYFMFPTFLRRREGKKSSLIFFLTALTSNEWYIRRNPEGTVLVMVVIQKALEG